MVTFRIFFLKGLGKAARLTGSNFNHLDTIVVCLDAGNNTKEQALRTMNR